jgi:ubiquinone/menaquinone biosynthesis C-methylase UbiE
VTFLQADAGTLPVPGGPLQAATFDHVFVCFVLEHLAEPERVLAHLKLMLRPGGNSLRHRG